MHQICTDNCAFPKTHLPHTEPNLRQVVSPVTHEIFQKIVSLQTKNLLSPFKLNKFVKLNNINDAR